MPGKIYGSLMWSSDVGSEVLEKEKSTEWSSSRHNICLTLYGMVWSKSEAVSREVKQHSYASVSEDFSRQVTSDVKATERLQSSRKARTIYPGKGETDGLNLRARSSLST